MGRHSIVARGEAPDVEIVDLEDPLGIVDRPLELVQVDLLWGALQQDVERWQDEAGGAEQY